MEQTTRESQRKVDEFRLELEETVGIIDFVYGIKELSNRGKDVHPGSKNRKDVQTVANSLRIAARRKGIQEEELDQAHDYIDLLSKPRVLLHEGYVNKPEPDGIIYKSSVRYLFLFSDALLITIKKEKKKDPFRKLDDVFDLQQVVWIKDMKIAERQMGEEFSFEIIVSKSRFRDQQTFTFSCENQTSYSEWTRELTYTLYGYHRTMPLAKTFGWFHSLVIGTLHSAAYIGDIALLKSVLKRFKKSSEIDDPDRSGMTALHWAALNGHESCVRLLIERGSDIDRPQHGLNTAFLLACYGGHDSVCRLLLDKGADLNVRNSKDCGAVAMAVVYGHSSKGLPWVVQLLTSKGLDVNARNRLGATPLHLCAERNLPRPVRLLVDSGADVNAIHETTKLTPLQMACKHSHPDVETIRSLIDKGAFVNWRDCEGNSAFDIIIRQQNIYMLAAAAPRSTSPDEGRNRDDDNFRSSRPSEPASQAAFRNVTDGVEQVGEWAVEALPTILEITRRGCRFDNSILSTLRPSLRNAITESRNHWESLSLGPNSVLSRKFMDFVVAREQACEGLLCSKELWSKDDSSSHCLLCAERFGLQKKLRRHHCRACGVLVCDNCSSKRVPLSSTASSDEKEAPKREDGPVFYRVCDGCFNRLMHEATQPSPDHYRVRHLKMCATELLSSIAELIDALDDPDGDPMGLQSSLRETMNLSAAFTLNEQDSSALRSSITPLKADSRGASRRETIANSIFSLVSGGSSSQLQKPRSQGHMGDAVNGGGTTNYDLSVAKVDALLLRDEKLSKAENLTSKFLEAADGYHRVVKKIVEKRNSVPTGTPSKS